MKCKPILVLALVALLILASCGRKGDPSPRKAPHAVPPSGSQASPRR